MAADDRSQIRKNTIKRNRQRHHKMAQQKSGPLGPHNIGEEANLLSMYLLHYNTHLRWSRKSKKKPVVDASMDKNNFSYPAKV